MGQLIKVQDMCKIYNPGENEVRALDHVNLWQLSAIPVLGNLR